MYLLRMILYQSMDTIFKRHIGIFDTVMMYLLKQMSKDTLIQVSSDDGIALLLTNDFS